MCWTYWGIAASSPPPPALADWSGAGPDSHFDGSVGRRPAGAAVTIGGLRWSLQAPCYRRSVEVPAEERPHGVDETVVGLSPNVVPGIQLNDAHQRVELDGLGGGLGRNDRPARCSAKKQNGTGIGAHLLAPLVAHGSPKAEPRMELEFRLGPIGQFVFVPCRILRPALRDDLSQTHLLQRLHPPG